MSVTRELSYRDVAKGTSSPDKIQRSYSTDDILGATVIPASKPHGGSLGFNVMDKIPRNVYRSLTDYVTIVPDDSATVASVKQHVPSPINGNGNGNGKKKTIKKTEVYEEVKIDKYQIPSPETKVCFELSTGTMETYYHRVFQEGFCLVLAWDNRYKGSKYVPNAMQQPFYITIGREKFLVFSSGIKFTIPDVNLDLIILLITSEEKLRKPEPEKPKVAPKVEEDNFDIGTSLFGSSEEEEDFNPFSNVR